MLVPRRVRHDQRAGERCDVEVEHVLRVAEDLERQREVRRTGGRVDQPGRELQLLRDVRRQKRDRVKAVRDVPLHPVLRPLAGEELRVLHVGERAQAASWRRPAPSRRCPKPEGGSPWPAAAARGSVSVSSGRRCSSSSDSKKNGMVSTLNASSSSARPAAVRNDACRVSKPGRIFVTIVDSSPDAVRDKPSA